MDARTALAALPERPVHPARRVAAWLARTSLLDEPQAPDPTSDYRSAAPHPVVTHIASESRRVLVQKLAFERLGILRLQVLFARIDSEIVVDDTATVRLTVGKSGGKTFEAFDTYFDDGFCLMTWVQTPALTARKVIDDTGRTGTGDLARDLLAHRTAVAQRTSTGHTALHFANVEAHLALSRHYMLHEMPLSLAWRYVLSLIVVVTFGVMIVVKLVMVVTRPS
jgi:hypothetical protein